MALLNEFLENMNHEMPGVSITLTQKGYRCDGTGFKHYCGMNNLKSVDYIYAKPEKYPLIEFSDLEAQFLLLLDKAKSIKTSNLPKKQAFELYKKEINTIPNELKEKYLGTKQILQKLDKHFSDVPESLKNTDVLYIILKSPIKINTNEFSRVLEKWKSSIMQSIPKCMYTEIVFIFIEEFVTY